MRVEITPYAVEHIDSVRHFNHRMALGGEGEYQIPCDLRAFDDSAGGPLPLEGWLAVQDGVVRGGYLLRWQEFSFSGEIRSLAFYHLSVSEGAIDPQYAQVSTRMITSATSKAPLMFALGMGGIHNRLPRFLKAFGWKLHEVPFLFRAVRPGRVVSNISALRSTPFRRAIMDVAASTGLARLGFGAIHRFRRSADSLGDVRWQETPDFGPWADAIWSSCCDRFRMIAVRHSRALNALYPETLPRLTRLIVYSGQTLIGWAVVLNTKMNAHKQFGDLHVGTLVDCLSRPEDALAVVKAAESFLEERDVDLIVSNQCHQLWRSSLLSLGFLEGPSNFAFAASKALCRILEPFDTNVSGIHLTRGDGDGPIHL